MSVPTEQDVLDAALDAILDIAAAAQPGPDGEMDEETWAAIQHVLDMAEDPAALAEDLADELPERLSHDTDDANGDTDGSA